MENIKKKKNSVKLIHFTSFLAWTFLNFLAHPLWSRGPKSEQSRLSQDIFSESDVCFFLREKYVFLWPVKLICFTWNTTLLFSLKLCSPPLKIPTFQGGPEQFIGWFMKFSVDFHKLKNRFKITWLAVSPCLAWFLCDVKRGRKPQTELILGNAKHTLLWFFFW